MAVCGGLGGLGELHSATAEVQKICNEVKKDVEGKLKAHFAVFKVISFRKQTVRGYNYFVKIHVGGSKYIHVRIFVALPDENKGPEVQSIQNDKGKDDEIERF
ncbi:cystatin-A1-like [Pelobates fuscus]|uniref:cystatin-A1-like n=1 Tax=Pelobates fuscus TaxID=191477 RepID=UPI002FE4E4F7